MNDEQKTREQLLEELADSQELLEQEQRRADLERERSLALQEVSKRVAASHDTDEVLDLIVNEAARLVGADGADVRVLEGDLLVLRSNIGPMAEYLAATIPTLQVGEAGGISGRVMATKKPLVGEEASAALFEKTRQTIEEQGGDPAGIACIPLLANGNSVGTLTVGLGNQRGRRLTEDEVFLLAAFADQASLALEKARLLNEAERERERADALYRISNLLAGVHETGDVLDLIVQEAARLIGAPAAFIRLVEDGVLVSKAATAAAADFLSEIPSVMVIEEGTSPPGHVMATKTPLVWEDAEHEEMLFPEQRAALQKYGFHGTVTAPLLANGQSMGILALFDTRIRRFTEDEIALLMALADQAALALEKARLLNEAETERERSDALYRVSNRLAGAYDTDEVLDLIVNEAARLVGAAAAYIRLLEDDTLVPSAATDSAAAWRAESAAVLAPFTVGSTSNVGHVMSTKEPRVVEDSSEVGLASSEARLLLQKYGFRGAA